MSTSQPLVSIIIPCFNAEKYVGEAIQSALAQTWPNKEVIVIDDGSNDDSMTVIRSFEGQIRWESLPHRGACAARNRGVELACGPYVQFLDADDVLFSEKLDKQVAVMASTNADVVFCDWTVRVPDKPDVDVHSRPMKDDDAIAHVLTGKLPTEAPLHRKTLLQKIGGFCVDLPCAQEFDLHLRMAAAGFSFRHCPETLFEIRTRRDGISSDYERVLDQYERILPPVFRKVEICGMMTEQRRRLFARLMANAARSYMGMGSREKGDRYFVYARAMHPKGGLEVYDWRARLLRLLVGPFCVERLASLSRRLRGTQF